MLIDEEYKHLLGVVLDLLNCMQIHARLHCFSHGITMEALRADRHKTAQIHLIEYTPAAVHKVYHFGLNYFMSSPGNDFGVRIFLGCARLAKFMQNYSEHQGCTKFVELCADCFYHSNTIEPLTSDRYKTAKFHRTQHKPDFVHFVLSNSPALTFILPIENSLFVPHELPLVHKLKLVMWGKTIHN